MRFTGQEFLNDVIVIFPLADNRHGPYRRVPYLGGGGGGGGGGAGQGRAVGDSGECKV